MQILYCFCGCPIWVLWNAPNMEKEFYLEDDPDTRITHCPECQTELKFENLLKDSPANALAKFARPWIDCRLTKPGDEHEVIVAVQGETKSYVTTGNYFKLGDVWRIGGEYTQAVPGWQEFPAYPQQEEMTPGENEAIVVGTTLLTRDGRKIGNAIVVGVDQNKGIPQFVIRTDFGNTAVLSAGEIATAFHVGRRQSVEKHWNAQQHVLAEWEKLFEDNFGRPHSKN